MNNDRLHGVWLGAGKRFLDHEDQRRRRQENRGPEGNWQEIEEPERLKARLRLKGMPAAMSESLTASAQTDVAMGNAMLERIINESQLMGVDFLTRGQRIARSVCRVVLRSPSGRTLGFGTGFLVSADLMMTNNHVLGDQQDAANSLAQFGFYEPFDGRPSTTVEFPFEPGRFFRTSRPLDFTLIAVAPLANDGTALGARGWNPLIRESGKSLVGEPVNIIQHPRGEPMQVAVRENEILDRLDNHLHYRADTDRGSSGSPVCNDVWEIAALHHSGVPKMDANGNILLTDGRIWDGNRSTIGQISWVANEGVRISRIVQHLDSLILGGSEKALYDACFQGPPASGVGAGESEAAPGGGSEPAMRQEADGSVSWYFRVNFGPAGATAPAPEPVATVTADGRTDDAAATRAQEILERFRPDLPYYDCAKDGEDRTTYYRDIDLTADGAALFDALHTRLVATHTTVLSYRSARLKHLYPWVDIQESGNLRNVYSGTILRADEVIAEELDRLEAARPGFLAEFSPALLEDEDDDDPLELALEAQMPFNCEHVVPQSWFEKKQPMKADLHHLFTCEPACNSFRSNIPYFDFDPLLEVEHQDCGRREGDKFEPEINHGVAARATLYFLLRYPGMIGDAARELQKERLAILLRWHAANTVKRYELHRNAAIAAVQGNRNPLIDHPELAEKIDFLKGFG